jgi:hypothetical protein
VTIQTFETWMHPCLQVQPSAIAGHGIFATDRIEADVVVIRLGGRLVSSDELHGDVIDTRAARDVWQAALTGPR